MLRDGKGACPELLLALSCDLSLYPLHQQIKSLRDEQHQCGPALAGSPHQHSGLHTREIGDVGTGP